MFTEESLYFTDHSPSHRSWTMIFKRNIKLISDFCEKNYNHYEVISVKYYVQIVEPITYYTQIALNLIFFLQPAVVFPQQPLYGCVDRLQQVWCISCNKGQLQALKVICELYSEWQLSSPCELEKSFCVPFLRGRFGERKRGPCVSSGLIVSSYQSRYAHASQSIYIYAANNIIFDMDSVNLFSNKESFFMFPPQSRCQVWEISKLGLLRLKL